MAEWSDYYSGQRVDSLARCVALRHHDARVGGSVPGLGSFNTVTPVYNLKGKSICQCPIWLQNGPLFFWERGHWRIDKKSFPITAYRYTRRQI